MGYPHVAVEVSNLTRSKPSYVASFLVDSGAVVCLAPQKELRSAGIEPEGREAYELADGTPVEYDYGFARLSFMGSETVTKIIFGPDSVEPLLGVTALESVGIGVDPVTQTLKRYAPLPLKDLKGPRSSPLQLGTHC
ncbi:MAG: clan AA aspartic protease [Verrucomicrobia bacterium]|nr:MAG: clan AA aspartic protease [Verrucomicrobiota bacterium]